jgi:xanthine dehydrogenase accessory factor
MAEWIDPIRQAVAWRQEGLAVAVATVLSTWGSSPCPPGSRLAVNERGDFAGSVSAGCVEGHVIATAREVIRNGVPKELTFGVSDETVWSTGFACGGEISVLISPFEGTDIARHLLDAAAKREAVTLVTNIETGVQTLDGVAGEGLFVEHFQPRPRLLVVGAVHIAQSLVQMAKLANFDVVVIDPRRAFATEERFPGVQLCCEWPDQALETLGLDPQTGVVTLAHDSKIDDPALLAAARSQVFHIAALGSRRTHAKRVERLLAAGLSQNEINRISAPAGINIGSLTPPEIALSILAEIISVIRAERLQRQVIAVNA